MSLFGALYSSVSGLKAQGTNLGIISDNISNVNTVGYKAGEAQFETLVTNSGSQVAYSPGGVRAHNRQLVDKQGLIQSTDAATDIAISGSGMFVVNSRAGSNGDVLYTRAGSFRTDNLGNFVNAQGFYLQGWPLDRDGHLPGEIGNLNTKSSAVLDSLETVNVETSSGVAAATTKIDVGANLQASETAYPGAGSTATMDINNAANYQRTADSIIVPGGVNTLTAGDAMTVTTGSGLTYTFTYGGFTAGTDVTAGPSAGGYPGNIFDAVAATQPFFSATPVPTGVDRTFTITSNGSTHTFTYATSSPTSSAGEFNNLNNLATAINEVSGLSARVSGNQLYVSAEDATQAVTFADGGAIGWVAELGMTNVAAASNRFNSLQGLANLFNASAGLTAVVNNPFAQATAELRIDDPLDTVVFADAGGNTGSVLGELGLATSGGAAPQTTGSLGPSYDSSGATGGNMASGSITPQFTRSVRVYDSLGTGHDLNMSFIKIADNSWAVEMYAKTNGEINSSLVNNQIAVGTVVFNGDGSLRSVSSGLTNPININWTNGAIPSAISMNWGTQGQPFGTPGATQIGLTDGLSQFDADYQVAFVNQNGAEVGSLTSVEIDEDGFVIANYSNGEAQKLYKLPIADFTNPNGLRAITGNVYAQTEASGEVNLRESGTSGVGTISPASLESSNVELAEELTDMIVAQRAYQASSKVISTTDSLLEELTRL